MNTIIEIEQTDILIRRRGRPIGSKNSTSVEQHNDRMTLRKESLKTNFQKYKAQHHDELKQVYLDHYYNNRERKLGRMNQLHRLKAHVKQLMNLDISILA